MDFIYMYVGQEHFRSSRLTIFWGRGGRGQERLPRVFSIVLTLDNGSVLAVRVSHLLTSPTVQSSSEDETSDLQNSVDGDINTCFTTDTETDPWWIVDLGAEYEVSGITLATSQDQTGVKSHSSIICPLHQWI